MTISAMMFDGPNRPLRRQDFPRPKLAVGEALVKVRLCTLCGSDLHTYSGRRAEPTPTILGHEIIGTIEELGSDLQSVTGEQLQVGDRITWAVAASCGTCFYCQRDWPQKCDHLLKYGHVKDRLHGGLATHCHLVKGTSIIKVPEHLPDELAAPAMCATATSAAAIRLAEEFLKFPDPVALVVGAGLLGCTTTAMLASRGVKVIVVDVEESRLDQARQFGAEHAILPDQLHHFIPRGADACLEFSGSLAGVQTCLEKCRIGGATILIGTVSPTPSVELFPEQLVRKCATIRGVHNYAPRDLATAIEFLAEQGSNFPLQQLGPRFPLNQVNEAFHYAEQHKPTRVLVEC
jgi:putative phosphonate catabolism associated alcohol dehydrogenase